MSVAIDNNFFLHFAPGSPDPVYREKPVFKRLQEQDPDLVRRCLDSGDRFSHFQTSREDHYVIIFPAYQLMANNVHATDPDIFNKQDPAGEFYLLR